MSLNFWLWFSLKINELALISLSFSLSTMGKRLVSAPLVICHVVSPIFKVTVLRDFAFGRL
jgi:hypothetical protein